MTDVTAELPLSASEVRAWRRLRDIRQIQDVMLRYVRCADRNDPVEMETIFWDGATDDHGTFKGTGAGFFASILANEGDRRARYHLTSPVRAEFTAGDQARVETYFFYTGVIGVDRGELLGALTGRYRDLFEERAGEWRILARTVIYDSVYLVPYEPGWDFFGIPEGHNRGTFAPDDAVFAADW